jgi:hypothetical protein
MPGAEQSHLNLTDLACFGMTCDVQSQVCEGGLSKSLSRTQEHQDDSAGFHRQLQTTHHSRRAAMEPCEDNFNTAAARCLFERPESLAVL